MSAIFNGSSAYLLAASAIVGSTPNYPVLIGGWIKLTNVTTALPIVFITDNAVLASLDYLAWDARGDVASDPVYAQCAAAGSGNSSSATFNGLTASTWLFCAAYFSANNSRQAALGSSLGTAQTTSRAVTGLTHVSIGTQYINSAPNGYFNGRMAGVFVASGFSTGNITTILTQLAAGYRPIYISGLSSFVNLYQPLLAGLDESGYVGPTLSNTNVTFDSGDHPTILSFNSAWARGSNQLLEV